MNDTMNDTATHDPTASDPTAPHEERLRLHADRNPTVRDGDAIVLIWTIDDLLSFEDDQLEPYDIDEQDAREILRRVERAYDPSIGITWDTLDQAVREYVSARSPRPPQSGDRPGLAPAPTTPRSPAPESFVQSEERMVTLSTAHIMPQDAKLLDADAKTPHARHAYPGAVTDHGGYGWLIPLGPLSDGDSSEDDLRAAGFSDAFANLAGRLARSGFDRLLLDRDGDLYPGLPGFPW